MKKIFTLFAAALMAAGVQAQVISFGGDDVCDKGAAQATYSNGEFVLNCTDTDASKLQIDANNCYFGNAEAQVKYTHRLKTGGKSSAKNALSLTVPSAGTVKISVRTGSNSDASRTLVLTQNGTELYNQVVKEDDAVGVKGLDETDLEKDVNVYPVVSVSVVAGTLEITYPVNGLNFYAFEFVAGEGGEVTPDPDPDPEPEPSAAAIDYPTSDAGITLSGTTAKGTVKIHENKDAVDCITLKNGYTTENVLNANYILLEVEGGFKTGDVVTVAGAINNSDETKRGTADLFVTADGSATTSLNVFEDFINGRLVADDIVPQTYTLEADYDKLYIGRNGNTGTNLTIIKVTRGGSDNILNVKTSLVENGVVYNLAGQKVAKNFKGLVIENGKKVVKK